MASYLHNIRGESFPMIWELHRSVTLTFSFHCDPKTIQQTEHLFLARLLAVNRLHKALHTHLHQILHFLSVESSSSFKRCPQYYLSRQENRSIQFVFSDEEDVRSCQQINAWRKPVISRWSLASFLPADQHDAGNVLSVVELKSMLEALQVSEGIWWLIFFSSSSSMV